MARSKAGATPAVVEVGGSLRRAAAALPGNVEGALEVLVAAWADRHGPELSSLARRAGALAGQGRPSISGVNNQERQRSWLAVEEAGQKADLDRLLASLTAGRCAECKVRLAQVAARPADPRTLETLVAIVEADPALRKGEQSPVPFTSAPNRSFWTALMVLLKELGDATVAPRLARARQRIRDTDLNQGRPGRARTEFERWLEARLDWLLPVLEARPAAPLDDDERAAAAEVSGKLDRAESAGQGEARTAEALYAAVWASPDADEPRQILADFLAERGDPRGEFIALQMARHRGTLTGDGKKREKELLKRHKKEWLGPIGALIQPYNLRFERGFLVTCQLEPNPILERTLGHHPAWSTIREFLLHSYSTARGEGQALVALLTAQGATQPPRLTRGIE